MKVVIGKAAKSESNDGRNLAVIIFGPKYVKYNDDGRVAIECVLPENIHTTHRGFEPPPPPL